MGSDTAAPTSSGSELAATRSSSPMDLLLTEAELQARGTRAPEYEAESRALASLLKEIDSPDGDVLQRLVDTAMSLCSAHSAGISVLQASDGAAVFRWRAVAGEWARFAGGTMPRNASPCGIVLDQNRALLFSHPERHYPIADMLPAISEVLLIPFHLSGQPVGTVWVISHDATRRFDQEDQRLMTSLARFASTACHLLEARSEAQASALESARLYEEAMAALRARDEFFATLSHELRTPMTSILGWAALLELHPESEQTSQAARAITSAASLQANLIDDLLDTARLMTGKFALQKGRLDLRDLLDDAVMSNRPSAEAKGIGLRQEVPVSLIISADDMRLRQVLSNLLSNAIKFTPQGGLVTMTMEREESEAVIRVTDTGEGIPAGFLARVFDRYAQLGESHQGGMGLGLAIAKHIVELHEGTIHAESAGPGKGSSFTVRLPLDAASFSPS